MLYEYCYHKLTNVSMRKHFILAMNELSDDQFFFEDMGAKPENTENQVNETDSGKKTQIGIRLDGPGSKMLAEIRNWCLKKKSIEFLGEEGMGVSIATTDTTLARFILDAGIKALYSDLQNDQLIEEVAIWFKENAGIGKVSFWLSDKYGLPDELHKKILILGFKRSQEISRSEEFTNVKTQSQRLDSKFKDQLKDLDELYNDLYSHEEMGY